MNAHVIVAMNADSADVAACTAEVEAITKDVEARHGVGTVRVVDLHDLAFELVSVVKQALARDVAGDAHVAREEAFEMLMNLLGGEP